MKITVYQAKGSAGKTPIATNIALDREYAIGTNEAFHVFDGFIPDDRLLVLDLTEAFPEMPDGIDIVFDLAGAISAQSHSITSAIRQSDLVIVPIFNEVKSLHSGIGTLREIEKIEGFKDFQPCSIRSLKKKCRYRSSAKPIRLRHIRSGMRVRSSMQSTNR